MQSHLIQVLKKIFPKWLGMLVFDSGTLKDSGKYDAWGGGIVDGLSWFEKREGFSKEFEF